MAHPNQDLINTFYQAFNAGDHAAMAACYHEDVEFQDPVFGSLTGSDASDMWEMLIRQAKTLDVTVRDIEAGNDKGSAKWTARYDFGKPPRKVVNHIHASFEFKDGKIVSHTDHFSFWRWSRMALGPLGLVMGWSSKVRDKVSTQARANLTRFTRAKKTE